MWRVLHEAFTGAWQRNIKTETTDTLFSYPTLYACIYRIASDIGKLPFTVRRYVDGVWKDASIPRYSKVLEKPNHYQTQAQFREHWILSKVIQGNAYILKERDREGRVIALYVLDPTRVMPLVTESGLVYYQINMQGSDIASPELMKRGSITIPAEDIIHDRCITLHHPLIGVPPITAASFPTSKNVKIMRNASEFFDNSSQPSGILTAPAGMSQRDYDDVEAYWQQESTGGIRVIGADMKFTAFSMKSVDSQMVEQMKYSDEQICQPFGIPPFKVGIGTIPTGLKVDGLNQLYYADALQTHIEHMEYLLAEGLEVPPHVEIALDLEPLIRMDEEKRASVEIQLVQGRVKKPDEARARFNLEPTDGGDTLWGQRQDYPLGMLADRTSWDEEFQKKPEPEATPAPEEPLEEDDKKSFETLKSWILETIGANDDTRTDKTTA